MRSKLLIIAAIILTGIGLIFELSFKIAKEQNLHSMTPIEPEKLTGAYVKNDVLGTFHNINVEVPSEVQSNILGTESVLGKKDQKRIEIDLTNQKLYAYEGSRKVYSFLVSTGKWGRTPTGEFRIWSKLKYVLMTGGSEELGTYYYLPNVPFTMFFSNNEVPAYKGFGIHGTYWHNNFGHPMSHGCINMKTEEAEKLFYWANPVLSEGRYSVRADGENTGTRVIIYGEAPSS